MPAFYKTLFVPFLYPPDGTPAAPMTETVKFIGFIEALLGWIGGGLFEVYGLDGISFWFESNGVCLLRLTSTYYLSSDKFLAEYELSR